jgi:hypothetical protein
VNTVQERGLSGESSQKGTEKTLITFHFNNGTYKVPCSRLEFQGFDKDLEADIRKAPFRRSTKS